MSDNVLEFLDKGSREYQKAVAFIRSGQGAEALKLAERLWLKGDGHARALMGGIYDFGLGGVAPNPSLAVSYYTEALEACGSLFAGRAMAKLLYLGRGIRMDRVEAFRIYQGCAEHSSDKMARLAVGLMLARGEGVEKDAAKAIPYLQASAEDGYFEALQQLQETFWEQGHFLHWLNGKVELCLFRAGVRLGLRRQRFSDWTRRYSP